MKRHFFVQAPVPLLAALTLVLLFDPSGFAKLSLICAVLHEGGHILAFWMLTGRLPRVGCSLCGLKIEMDGEQLSLIKENLLLLSGPLANLVVAALTGLLILSRATFARYFFACENLCLALFNLLPIGFLDGGRLIHNILGERAARGLRYFSALCCLVVAILGFWLFLRQRNGFVLLVLFCLMTLALIAKNLRE